MIDQRKAIEAANVGPEVKAILTELQNAINVLSETKYTFTKDLNFSGQNIGVTYQRQGSGANSGDGNRVRLMPVGTGSTTTTWEDLGKK